MSGQKLMLRLYTMDQTPNSQQALANIRRLLNEDVSVPHDLEVIDILKDPAMAKRDGIIAVPALLRVQPTPVRMIIGDLSDREKVSICQDIALPIPL